MRRVLIVLRLGLLAALLASSPASAQTVKPSAPGPLLHLSGWLVDWDFDRGLQEFAAHAATFDALHCFAVSFDPGHKLLVSPVFTEHWREIQRLTIATRKELWVTIVNDILRPDGRHDAKSSPLVQALLGGDAAFEAHLKEVAELAARLEVDGVELDYENLEPAVFTRFLEFAEALRRRLAPSGRKVSVLLEPQQRFLGAFGGAVGARDLPATVMFYDLHGAFSGPGPKATPDFLRQTFPLLAGKAMTAALATGAFQWTNGVFAASLAQSEVDERILAKRLVNERPDGVSPRLVYQEGGKTHEIWHMDPVAMLALWDTAASLGARDLALWRLGGNNPALFDGLAARKRLAP